MSRTGNGAEPARRKREPGRVQPGSGEDRPPAAESMLPQAESPRFELIDITREKAKQAIEADEPSMSVKFVERQRDAIDLIHQATVATLTLAEAITRGAEASPAAEAWARHRRERSAALHNAADDFFQSAMSLIAAIASAGAPVFNSQGPARSLAGEGETTARCLAALTLQQRRVLSLLMAGLPNKLIAYQLGVTEATVKAHVSQLLVKFNVHSRAQIMARMSRLPGPERLN